MSLMSEWRVNSWRPELLHSCTSCTETDTGIVLHAVTLLGCDAVIIQVGKERKSQEVSRRPWGGGGVVIRCWWRRMRQTNTGVTWWARVSVSVFGRLLLSVKLVAAVVLGAGRGRHALAVRARALSVALKVVLLRSLVVPFHLQAHSGSRWVAARSPGTAALTLTQST